MSAISSKIGASVINGGDRSACNSSLIKIDAEQTLNNNGGDKNFNLNVKKFAVSGEKNEINKWSRSYEMSIKSSLSKQSSHNAQ